VVRSSHERWDGAGYPDGIAGEQIPIEARIVFACDAYDAMTSARVYRRTLSPRAALDEMRHNAGTQFDARVVAALEETLRSAWSAEAPAQTGAGPRNSVTGAAS